jgi:hypothetical protein
VEGAWGYAAGRGVLAWAEDTGNDYQLMCSEPARDGSPHRIGVGTVGKWPQPIHAARDVIVWVDGTGAVWAVRGCDGTPWQLPVDAPVVAVSYPDVFVVDANASVLRKVDLETNRVSAVVTLPRALWQHDDVRFAATKAVIVWSAAGQLTMLDRGTGRTRDIPAGLPASAGQNIDLTAGSRLIVASSRATESDPTDNAAFVYDLVTGTAVTLRSEAFATGDFLLWREETNYVLASQRN